MSTFPQIVSTPSPAGVALLAGRAVTDDGTSTTYCNLTNQAATQRVFFRGVTLAPCAIGEIPVLGTIGDDVPYVSSGTTARGDLLAAKYHVSDVTVQGTLMKIGTQLTGDLVVGYVTTPATDTATGMCRLVGHPTL